MRTLTVRHVPREVAEAEVGVSGEPMPTKHVSFRMAPQVFEWQERCPRRPAAGVRS